MNKISNLDHPVQGTTTECVGVVLCERMQEPSVSTTIRYKVAGLTKREPSFDKYEVN